MESNLYTSKTKEIEGYLNKIQSIRLNKDFENAIPNAEIINSLYNELNNCVMSVDKKVGDALKKHEQECLKNYKDKMYEMQKEIRMLKDRANEEENNKRKALKVKELEQKRNMLKEEAEELDKTCKEQKRSLDKWKIRSEEMLDDKKFYEEQLDAARKQQASLHEQLLNSEGEKFQKDNSLIEDSPQMSEKLPMYSQSAISNTNYFAQVTHRIKETIGHMYSQLDIERKNLRSLKSAKTNFLLEKGELEDLFLMCIEDVKREIYIRKIKASKSIGSNKKITEKDRIIEFNEFKEIDKRKVMENFLNSEKVRKFLYEKMFGKTVNEEITLEKSHSRNQMSLNKSRSSSKPSTSNGLLSHIFSKLHFSPEAKSLHRPSSVPSENKIDKKEE